MSSTAKRLASASDSSKASPSLLTQAASRRGRARRTDLDAHLALLARELERARHRRARDAEDTDGALGVLEGRFPYKGYGPALHVHSREDEAIYVLEGQIRFRVGDDEFVAGPGTWVWQPRGVPQAFSVESDSARALIIFTPGGLERMFEDGGVPAAESAEPPPQPQPEPEPMAALATRFGFEFVGPQLG